nr:adenylate/guanylate cyclase domain-containing protein [Ramlibacter albus]
MAFAVHADAQGAPPVPLGPDEVRVDLSRAAEVLEDPEGRLTFEEVRRSTAFRPGPASRGRSASAFWLRYELDNRSGRTSWWLDTGSRTLHEIDFFAVGPDGRMTHQSASANLPFGARPLPTLSFVFPVTLPANARSTLYLRFRSTSWMAASTAPVLWEPAAHQQEVAKERTQWLLYVGMALALALFNLLLYAALRETDYLVYVLSLFGTVWTISSAYGGFGAAYEMLWPDSPVFEQVAWIAPFLFVAVFSTLFYVRVTRMRAQFPHASRVVFAGACAFAVVVLVRVAIAGLQLPVPPKAQILLGVAGNLGFLLWVLSSVGVMAFLVAARNRQAQFLAVAVAPVALMATYQTVMRALGELPPVSWLLWTSMFEFVTMALLLADRFRQEREQRQTAQDALVAGLQRSERELEAKVQERTAQLEREQVRTRELLHNILPAQLAQELAETGAARPARHDSVSILFTDFSGFTQSVSMMPADRLVTELNEIFAAFDDIAEANGIEKIKTIGDAYMAAGGLPTPCERHAQRCVRAGLAMIEWMEKRNAHAPFKWQLRVGVHSGQVVAGVVGKRKYAYDVWGDSVNIASRMESAGEPGRVNISAYTYDLVRGEFECEYRGRVPVKGKGEVDMYFVVGPAAQAPS